MTDLKISAADARLILVAIDKLTPSFYSTEAYGAAIRLHIEAFPDDAEHPEVKVRPVTDYRSELEKSDAP